MGKVRLNVPGRHSVYNSLAAAAVGLELDVSFRRIAAAFGKFAGIDRRFHLRGRYGDSMVVDDYGHHPTEIEATLSAAREGFGARTIAVFQPHRYSRTRALLEEFGRAFFLADHVIVTDIYAAGETPMPGIDGARVVDSLVRHGHPSVEYVPRLASVPARLRKRIQPGDLVLTLGAGDVWKAGQALLNGVRRPGSRARGKHR